MVQPCSGTPSRTKFVARCSPTGRRPPLHPLFCPAGAAAVSVPLCAACRAGRGGGAGVGQLLDAPRCRGSVQQPAGACRGVGWWLGAQGRVVGMQDVCSETAQALHGAAACPSGVVSECVSLPLPSCRRVPPAALPPPPPPPSHPAGFRLYHRLPRALPAAARRPQRRPGQVLLPRHVRAVPAGERMQGGAAGCNGEGASVGCVQRRRSRADHCRPPRPQTPPPPAPQVMLNPFHTPTTKITAPLFHHKVRQLARNYFR